MNNKLIKKLKIKILYFLFFIFLNSSFAYSEILDQIKITGNDRLAKETIIMFSDLELGKNIDQNDLNLSMKNLYNTNYFKNVSMSFKNNSLEIKVEENPIIQNIIIKGVKNKTILESLNILTKNEKYPYLKNKIIDQKNLLLNALRASGFYLQKFQPK